MAARARTPPGISLDEARREARDEWSPVSHGTQREGGREGVYDALWHLHRWPQLPVLSADAVLPYAADPAPAHSSLRPVFTAGAEPASALAKEGDAPIEGPIGGGGPIALHFPPSATGPSPPPSPTPFIWLPLPESADEEGASHAGLEREGPAQWLPAAEALAAGSGALSWLPSLGPGMGGVGVDRDRVLSWLPPAEGVADPMDDGDGRSVRTHAAQHLAWVPPAKGEPTKQEATRITARKHRERSLARTWLPAAESEPVDQAAETARARTLAVTWMPPVDSHCAGAEQAGDWSLVAAKANVLQWLPPVEGSAGLDEAAAAQVLAWLPAAPGDTDLSRAPQKIPPSDSFDDVAGGCGGGGGG